MAGAVATTCGSFESRSIRGRQSLMPSLWIRSKLTWEVDPSRRSCRSWRNPLLMASAITREATPAATPAMEMPVITPMKAWRRLALRYRVATKSSKRIREAISRQLLAFGQFDYSDGVRVQWQQGFPLLAFHPSRKISGSNAKAATGSAQLAFQTALTTRPAKAIKAR